MPDGIPRERVEALAALANLDLEPAEIDLVTRHLGEFLAYADAVQDIDTTGVPPTTHVATTHVAERADETRPCLPTDEALAQAPEAAAGLFKVPRVIG